MGSYVGKTQTNEDQVEWFLKTGIITPVASLADVPVTPNTAYLVDIDGVILTSIPNTKRQTLSGGAYDWWTNIMCQPACQMYIVTARDVSAKQRAINQLAKASITPILYDEIYCQGYKGGVLKRLLPTIGTRSIVCIDDQFMNLLEYNDISPRAKLYIVNPHIKVTRVGESNQILIDDCVVEHIPEKYWYGEGT